MRQKGRYSVMAVYKIVNTITGDIYVGSSVYFTYRKWCHLRDLNLNKHHSPILQNSWNKYGAEAFSFDIVEIITDKLLLVPREQFWMDLFKPRYNCSPTARSPLGVKHTDQARRNMSESHKGIRPTKEALSKRSLKQGGRNHWNYGKDVPQERKDKIRDGVQEWYKTHQHPQSGITRPDEVKKKISHSLSIPVCQYSRSNEFLSEWESGKVAAQALGLKAPHISQCLAGKAKSTGGFVWKRREAT